MITILLCDDEKDIVNALKIYLSNPEYRLLEANNGEEALGMIREEEVHLVLLDIMMPVMDGITALAKMREISNVPVILLTAKGEDADKVLGLGLGADDYITKPFSPVEVVARVKSQLRRYLDLGSLPNRQEVFAIGGVELNDSTKEVTVDGESISLTPKEFEILRLLMSSPGRVLSPKDIYSEVWKERPLGSDNTVAVHIRHLREKIEINPAEPRYIKVIFGQGYKFEKGRNLK